MGVLYWNFQIGYKYFVALWLLKVHAIKKYTGVNILNRATKMPLKT
jgi:hypothetical protein